MVWKKDKEKQDLWINTDGRYVRIYGDDVIIGKNGRDQLRPEGYSYKEAKNMIKKLIALPLNEWNGMIKRQTLPWYRSQFGGVF